MAETINNKTIYETMSGPLTSISTPQDNQKQKRRKGNANWRLSVLATPRNPRGKFTEAPYVFDSGVSPLALEALPNDRVEQMATPNLRSLYVNKREFAGNPNTFKNYAERMDKQIDSAWNTIYNEYKKARRDKRLKQLKLKAELKHKRSRSATHSKKDASPKKHKGGKKSRASKSAKGRKSAKDEDTASEKSEDFEKQFQEWVSKNALPKPVFHPPPIQRGPIAKLDQLKDALDALATPKDPVPKYVPKKPPDHVVSVKALNYEITEQILELAKPPEYRMKKEEEVVLGSVRPAALLYKPTERILQLATPRARASATDADVKEEPFAISKNALKYKATPRIIELAKPIDRK